MHRQSGILLIFLLITAKGCVRSGLLSFSCVGKVVFRILLQSAPGSIGSLSVASTNVNRNIYKKFLPSLRILTFPLLFCLKEYTYSHGTCSVRHHTEPEVILKHGNRGVDDTHKLLCFM